MIRQAIVRLLTELTDQLEEVRIQRINRRMFGQHGEAAYAALSIVRDSLRALNKYGASADMELTCDKRGKVHAHRVYSSVCRIIEGQCPNMEEVWG